MDQLSLGVIARSHKENEQRLAIHPLHVERIETGLRRRIYLERGYGERFGVPDGELAGYVAGLRTREQLLAECDVLLLPKPLPQDLGEMREGQVLWGWPHCVQNEEITQLGIDRRLTLIAFEAMIHWYSDGSFSLHVFHKNNELAGYCSVLHAMQLIGTTGEYGRPLRAGVISFGATGRGAVTALNAACVNDVHVLTHRDVTAVASPIHSARMVQFERDTGKPRPVPCAVRKRPRAAGGLPRQIRHRGQLRAPGHRRPADVAARGRATHRILGDGTLIMREQPRAFAQREFVRGTSRPTPQADNS